MRSRFLFAVAAAALFVPADRAHAQRPRHESAITISRGSFAATPFAGYLVSERFVDGPLGTDLGTSGSPVFGLELSMPLAPASSLVGTIGYGSGDLRVGVPFVGGVDIGTSNTLLMDAAVELRGENMSARFTPFAQLGGGAIRRDVEVLGVRADATDFHVSGGLGANIPFGTSAALRLMAKDYYGKADFGSVASFNATTEDIHTVTLVAGLRLTF